MIHLKWTKELRNVGEYFFLLGIFESNALAFEIYMYVWVSSLKAGEF